MTSAADVGANLEHRRRRCWTRRAPPARAWRCCRRTSPSWGARDADKRAIAERDGERSGPGLPERAARASSAVDRRAAPRPSRDEPGRARRRRLPGLRRRRAARRRATTRSICSTSIFRARTRATASPPISRRARACAGADARGPARAVGVLRHAFSGALPAHGGGRRAVVHGAGGVHGTDRARALGDAAARARHREPELRGRRRRNGGSTPAAARPTVTASSSITGARCSVGCAAAQGIVVAELDLEAQR